MNDAPGESQFESRMPDDPGYWDGLGKRIMDSAEPILREHRGAQPWWRPLAKWSPAIGVAAAVALLLAALAGPPEPERPMQVSFAQLLAPDESVAQAVVGGAPPEDISYMLLIESGGGR